MMSFLCVVSAVHSSQVALDQSAFLLDVATVDGSWDAVREKLAALYEEGGLPEMAKFVMAA